ncbi:MAG: hypothetical protein CVU50_01575 [Candidatus Cloacimonetes bacterium HGW-Cloacimonetes-3]|nr:MAG: hypothetical protein CVU50_01575 [Candidatus Cloacimonetes bacterium HGW-Cloacimonetes-3]
MLWVENKNTIIACNFYLLYYAHTITQTYYNMLLKHLASGSIFIVQHNMLITCTKYWFILIAPSLKIYAASYVIYN